MLFSEEEVETDIRGYRVFLFYCVRVGIIVSIFVFIDIIIFIKFLRN